MAPTLDEVVAAAKTITDPLQARLMGLRAPCKERTIFGPAGRAVVRTNGERVLYGSNGAAIARVIEDPLGGTQIEEDDRLHAVVRPQTARVTVSRSTGEVTWI